MIMQHWFINQHINSYTSSYRASSENPHISLKMDNLQGFFIIFIIILLWNILNHPGYINNFINFNESLQNANYNISSLSLSFHVLDLFTSLHVCILYRSSIKSCKSWFESLIGCTLYHYGGGILVALLMGQPPAWILSNSSYSSFLLAWYLIFAFPLDLFWRTIGSFKHLLFITGFVASISQGHAIHSWGIDISYKFKKTKDSIFYNVLIGTLNPSGGSIINDFLGLTTCCSFQWIHATSLFTIGSHITNPVLNRSFLLSILYYYLIHFAGYGKSSTAAHHIITSIQIINFFVQYFWPEIDVFTLVSSFILKLFLVPLAVVPEIVGINPVSSSEKED